MTKTGKIIAITSSLLLGAVAAFALVKKKNPNNKIVKKVGKILWPEDPDSAGTIEITESGETSIKPGSSGRYVEQLQELLNDIHKSIKYINNNCGITWGYFNQWTTQSNGNILDVTGKFDDKTAKVAQFYLNRQEIDLQDLDMFNKKMNKQLAGDKCIYPLSVVL